MNASFLVGLVAAALALVLALRSMRVRALPPRKRAMMAGAWVAIIAGLAVVFGHHGS